MAQSDRTTDGYGESLTDPAQRTKSVKIFKLWSLFFRKQSGGKAPRHFDLIPVREVLDMEALEARQLAMDSDPRVTGTREGDTANTIDQV